MTSDFLIFATKIATFMINFITEKEFVPEIIYRCGTFKNEAEKGLYQIVYGVLQHYMMYDDIYDLIVRICKEQKSEVVKQFKLTEWRNAVNGIISKLENLEKNYGEAMVYIPFTYYYDSLRGTLSRFQFVRFTINEVLAKGDSQMEASSSPQYDYPVKALDLLIEDYRFKTEHRHSDGFVYDASYLNTLIHDELIRRGVKVVTESHFHHFDSKTNDPVYCDKTFEISPSEHFKHPEKFFELNRFNAKHKLLKVKIEEDADDKSYSNELNDEKTNAKERVGILFYMLKELSQETTEKHWNTKAAAIINYVLGLLGKKYEPDTSNRYIRSLRNLSKNDMGSNFYETVNDILKKNGFVVPKEIKERLPKKQ